MKLKEDEDMFEEYRELHWGILITWILIFIVGICFLYGLGYCVGEYIVPFITSLEGVDVERAGWLLALFFLVWWVYVIYTRIEK